jgi:hypothetical protein
MSNQPFCIDSFDGKLTEEHARSRVIQDPSGGGDEPSIVLLAELGNSADDAAEPCTTESALKFG